MSITALPVQASRRYGDLVIDGAPGGESDLEDAVHALSVRLVSGDETALEEIYDRWSALVHTFALRALRDTHDAEEVTQQVFVAVWRSRHTLTPSPQAFPAWLIGIARHKIADVRAARSRDAARVASVAAAPDPAELDPRVNDPDVGVADRLVVRQAVDELPDPRRTIVMLAFWQDLTHAEIATTTGLPLGTVKSHVRRGLVHLQQQLEGVRHVAR